MPATNEWIVQQSDCQDVQICGLGKRNGTLRRSCTRVACSSWTAVSRTGTPCSCPSHRKKFQPKYGAMYSLETVFCGQKTLEKEGSTDWRKTTNIEMSARDKKSSNYELADPSIPSRSVAWAETEGSPWLEIPEIDPRFRLRIWSSVRALAARFRGGEGGASVAACDVSCGTRGDFWDGSFTRVVEDTEGDGCEFDSPRPAFFLCFPAGLAEKPRFIWDKSLSSASWASFFFSSVEGFLLAGFCLRFTAWLCGPDSSTEPLRVSFIAWAVRELNLSFPFFGFRCFSTRQHTKNDVKIRLRQNNPRHAPQVFSVRFWLSLISGYRFSENTSRKFLLKTKKSHQSQVATKPLEKDETSTKIRGTINTT